MIEDFDEGNSLERPLLHVPVDCSVTIANAPEDVRAEIEAWVRAEPRCETTLDIVVEPSADGLHLIATDREGNSRDRTVPDGRSAAVLVVSWMADDESATPPAAPPIAHPAVVIDDERPFEVRSTPALPLVAHAITLGVVTLGDDAGVRGQVDLVARGPWRLGLAAGFTDHVGGQLRVVGAFEHAWSRVSLRAQIGLGADLPTGGGHDDLMRHARDSRDAHAIPALDAAVFGGLQIGSQWRLLGGPLVERSLERDAEIRIGAFLGIERGL